MYVMVYLVPSEITGKFGKNTIILESRKEEILLFHKQQFICYIVYLLYIRTRLSVYLNLTWIGGMCVISGKRYLCSLTNTIAGPSGLAV